MANAQMMIAHTLTCHTTKLSAHLGKAAPSSGMHPAGATIRTRIHVAVAKDEEKGKEGRETKKRIEIFQNFFIPE